MHSDTVGSYIGALVIVAVALVTSAWGSAYAAMLLATWSGQ